MNRNRRIAGILCVILMNVSLASGCTETRSNNVSTESMNMHMSLRLSKYSGKTEIEVELNNSGSAFPDRPITLANGDYISVFFEDQEYPAYKTARNTYQSEIPSAKAGQYRIALMRPNDGISAPDNYLTVKHSILLTEPLPTTVYQVNDLVPLTWFGEDSELNLTDSALLIDATITVRSWGSRSSVCSTAANEVVLENTTNRTDGFSVFDDYRNLSLPISKIINNEYSIEQLDMNNVETCSFDITTLVLHSSTDPNVETSVDDALISLRIDTELESNANRIEYLHQ